MNEILQRAREDLKRLEAAAEEARKAYERAAEQVEEHRGFVLKLELYANGFSAMDDAAKTISGKHMTDLISPVVFFKRPLPIVDGLQRRTVVTIPREGTKRYEIGNAALKAIRAHGAIHTADLLQHIPDALFEGSENPKNYLSNALSKDARIVATPQGWDINTSLPQETEGAEEKA